jgi:hypothetical protein
MYVNLTRRSFVSALGGAPLFPGMTTEVYAQTTGRSDEDGAAAQLPRWPLSPDGKRFELQMYGELIHHQLYSPPQVPSGWSKVALATEWWLMTPHLPGNHVSEIEDRLSLERSEVALLKKGPNHIFKKEEWQARASQLTAPDAIRLYMFGAKLHHEAALLALARRFEEPIATYKISHAPVQGPNRPPYNIKQAVALYFSPKGHYGLGGTDDDQARARQYLFMVRNYGPLDPEKADTQAKQLLPVYAVPLSTELLHNERARIALHIPVDSAKYKQGIEVLQTVFPREFEVASNGCQRPSLRCEGPNEIRTPVNEPAVKLPPIY